MAAKGSLKKPREAISYYTDGTGALSRVPFFYGGKIYAYKYI